MTLREACNYGEERLRACGIEDAAIDAWYLLEYVTGWNRASYFMRMHETMPEDLQERYLAYIEQRGSHVPLQHITGVQAFMGMDFEVNEDVLVPRQDTEVLVELALEVLEGEKAVLDMCTGSGCIAISIAKLRPEAEVTAVDVSGQALQVAERNAARLGAEVTFCNSNLFEEIEGRYDLIVSNPPYIRTAVIAELKEEVRLHDPMLALDGKEDGLYFYRKIVEESPKYLKETGHLYFEIGHDQGDEVKMLMEKAGFVNVTVKKDLAGLDRVVFGVYNTEMNVNDGGI